MPRIVLGTTVGQRQPARPCFCHSRSLNQTSSATSDVVLSDLTKSRRVVKSEKSFDELSPVRELSPSSTLTNSTNEKPPSTDEINFE